MAKLDLIIVGGGLVGLATGYQYLQHFPDHQIAVLEKESAVGLHQSGRNSGVLHSGVYYKPGSYKAQMSLAGKALMERFLEEENIPFDLCGKVIVAKSEAELPALAKILANGRANGVACEQIGRERLREIEPHVAGVAAIHVPQAGIADYPAVARRLAEKINEQGSTVHTGVEVREILEEANGVVLKTDAGAFAAEQIVTCAGLYADRIAKMTAADQVHAQIVPFRGEYYQLRPQAEHLCNGLIYPVPDPQFPFLGVHFTKMVEGGVDCGPNAVLALAREGYSWGEINGRDLWESLTYSGFQRLAWQHWLYGLGEMWRSLSKAAFVRALQGLIPEIQAADLAPHPAGVRAQALTPQGDLLYDFTFAESARVLHVVNAPSPAATACLTIGLHLVNKLQSGR